MNISLLQKLITASGISGVEDDVRALLIKEIRPFVDDVKVDALGNLIAHKKGASPKVMLAAHMDEVGLVASAIDADGSIYFSRLGGIEPLTLIGQRVEIITHGGSRVGGVITTPEVNNGEYAKELPTTNELFIDAGFDRKELEKIGVSVGCFIELVQPFFHLANQKVFCGKALDDRIGCFIVLELAKQLKHTKQEIFYVFTVQEEMGLYGAITSTYQIEPHWAIAVDMTSADDRMRVPSKFIGKGPCITVKDAQMLTNRCVNAWLIEIARKKNIPVQFDVNESGTTDAMSISLSRGGVPATVVGVAVKNLHSTISMAHLDDVENALALLAELLKNPPKTCLVKHA